MVGKFFRPCKDCAQAPPSERGGAASAAGGSTAFCLRPRPSATATATHLHRCTDFYEVAVRVIEPDHRLSPGVSHQPVDILHIRIDALEFFNESFHVALFEIWSFGEVRRGTATGFHIFL